MARDGRSREMELLEISDEIYRSYFAFKDIEEKQPFPGGRTGRFTLFAIFSEGPLTVPDLAYRKAVSRQRMQQVVDLLIEQGMLLKESNPRHQKSNLINLTVSGRRSAESLLRQERRFFRDRIPWVSMRKISTCLEVIRELRRDLEKDR